MSLVLPYLRGVSLVRKAAGDWDESAHPRADDGKFGSGAGGGKPEGKEPAAKPDAPKEAKPAGAASGNIHAHHNDQLGGGWKIGTDKTNGDPVLVDAKDNFHFHLQTSFVPSLVEAIGAGLSEHADDLISDITSLHEYEEVDQDGIDESASGFMDRIDEHLETFRELASLSIGDMEGPDNDAMAATIKEYRDYIEQAVEDLRTGDEDDVERNAKDLRDRLAVAGKDLVRQVQDIRDSQNERYEAADQAHQDAAADVIDNYLDGMENDADGQESAVNANAELEAAGNPYRAHWGENEDGEETWLMSNHEDIDDWPGKKSLRRYFNQGWGVIKRLATKAGDWDESDHPRADDGKFGSGGGSSKEKPGNGAKPAPPRDKPAMERRPEGLPKVGEDEGAGNQDHPGDGEHSDSAPGETGSDPRESIKDVGELHSHADQAAKGFLARMAGKIKGVALKVLGKVKDGLKKQYEFLERRYGRKAAIAVFAGGCALGLATPLAVVPGSTMIGAVPFAAIAEIYTQARKLFGKDMQPMAMEEVWVLSQELLDHAHELATPDGVQKGEWAETDHPRGQPGNAGQFGPGGGGKPHGKPGGGPGNKPSAKPSGKPSGAKPGDKPEAKPNKPEGKQDAKPGGKEGGKPDAGGKGSSPPARPQDHPLPRSESWYQARDKCDKHVMEMIEAAKLPEEMENQFKEAAFDTFDNMSEAALTRFRENVHSMEFFQTPQELTKAMGGNPDEGLLGGCFQVSKEESRGLFDKPGESETKVSGKLLLDGGLSDKDTVQQLYAHEFAHAVDGNPHSGPTLTSSPKWKAAWEKEISGKELSNYSWEDEVEGFAEFYRFVASGPPKDLEDRKKKAKAKFPKCYEFLEEAKLVP